MQEERVALGSQAQASGGAGEQAYLQFAFQALQRRAGHRRGNLQLARGGGQRAAVAGVDEHLEVVVTQHFQDSFERVFPDSLFFSDLK